MKKFILIFILAYLVNMPAFSIADDHKKGYCSVNIEGQLGNQLFQIAAAYAYSLDNNLQLIVNDFSHKTGWNIPYNGERFFHVIDSTSTIPIELETYREPSFNYHPIPIKNNIKLYGYFQSEKYFKHRRKEILELFKMPQDKLEYILNKYPELTSSNLVVGVQIRDYRKDVSNGEFHPTYGRSYYKQAFAKFAPDTVFFVSSNNKQFARECTLGLSNHIIYLDEDYINEFYILTLCKSFIISNSSFGWWASWFSTFEPKKIIAPSPWFALPYNAPMMMKDLVRSSFILIKSQKI